jgi:hypothetical protein
MPVINNSMGVVDKRHKQGDASDRIVGRAVYTANAGGTTTTLVGAAPAFDVGTNVMRLKDRFKLYTAGTTLKEETVFTVTALNAAGTSVTFAPAAAVATVSTDVARKVSAETYFDEAAMDARLTELNGAYYTAARLLQMTFNDKRYALRVLDDPAGI